LGGWNNPRVFVYVTPQAGFLDVPYVLIMDIDGEQTEFPRTGVSGITTINLPASSNVKFYLQASEAFDVNVELELYSDFPTTVDFNNTTGVITLGGNIYFSDQVVNGILQAGQLPKIKVIDFLKGIIKAFNLIILPTTSTSFKVQSLDDWYAQGQVKDFTRYADVSKIDIARPDLNSTLNFSYKEPKTLIQDNYFDRNNDYYGDLEYDADFEGSTLDVSLPFENLMFSNFSDSTGLITDVNYALVLDDKLEEVQTAPILFYNKGVATLDNSLGVYNDAGTTTEVLTYNVVGQENGLNDTLTTTSLNWGSEVSTYTLTVQSNSLFNNYWSNYISNLYDIRRREVTVDCYLPPIVLAKLNLNDKIIIKGKRYLINNYTAELTKGKVQFTLLNDLNEIPQTETNNEGLQYELQTGLTG
jgi:hypothetical protein